MSIGNFPESLSQAILVGIILVGRLGVNHQDLLLYSPAAYCAEDPWKTLKMTPPVCNPSSGRDFGWCRRRRRRRLRRRRRRRRRRRHRRRRRRRRRRRSLSLSSTPALPALTTTFEAWRPAPRAWYPAWSPGAVSFFQSLNLERERERERGRGGPRFRVTTVRWREGEREREREIEREIERCGDVGTETAVDFWRDGAGGSWNVMGCSGKLFIEGLDNTCSDNNGLKHHWSFQHILAHNSYTYTPIEPFRASIVWASLVNPP